MFTGLSEPGAPGAGGQRGRENVAARGAPLRNVRSGSDGTASGSPRPSEETKGSPPGLKNGLVQSG